MSVSRESEDLRWIKRKSEQDITGSKLGLSPRRRSIEKNKIQPVLIEEPDALSQKYQLIDEMQELPITVVNMAMFGI